MSRVMGRGEWMAGVQQQCGSRKGRGVGAERRQRELGAVLKSAWR